MLFRFKFYLSFLLLSLVGCSDQARFAPNELELATLEVVPSHRQEIVDVLEVLLGTPDVPRLPAEVAGLEQLMTLDRLKQAAGPVESHEVGVTIGLFRRHCARCHGVTGNGRGPTALYQHPYPRDFRRGVFKFTATSRGMPPTDADLHATLLRGSPGAAMPAFTLLKPEEREALVDYIKYLAIRGQLEEELIRYAADELEEDSTDGFDATFVVEDFLQPIVSRWVTAEEQVVMPNAVPSTAELASLQAAGEKLFHNEQRAGCSKCHGRAGQGGVSLRDFDIWNARRNEFALKTESLAASSGAASSDRRKLAEREKVVAKMFPPVPSFARRLGAKLRGGEGRLDLFRRLHEGIDGTPMPAVGGTLTEQEIWSLVAYIESFRETPAGRKGNQSKNDFAGTVSVTSEVGVMSQ